MKIKHAWLALTVALVGTVSAQVDPNRTIMIVNGEEIRGNEYYRRMEFLPGVGRTVNGKFVEAPPGILTMLRILDERLLLQLATQKGVGPTESEVQNEIKERMAGNPRLMEGLKALGLSDADLNYQVRVDLAEYKLRTQGITVTDQEVEKYFNDNPKLFSSAKSIRSCSARPKATNSESSRSRMRRDAKPSTMPSRRGSPLPRSPRSSASRRVSRSGVTSARYPRMP